MHLVTILMTSIGSWKPMMTGKMIFIMNVLENKISDPQLCHHGESSFHVVSVSTTDVASIRTPLRHREWYRRRLHGRRDFNFNLKNKKKRYFFISGGSYILSRKALVKFADIVAKDGSLFTPDGPNEDLSMGDALAHSAIFVDCRDQLLQRRFFPLGFEYHINNLDPSFWYKNYAYYNVTQGSLNCCSDIPISFHYITPPAMYQLEYFVYHVHPFGIEKNFTESLPRNLTLKEIIEASDTKSFSPNFRNHTDFHNMSSSEIFWFEMHLVNS